jgi:hypothetical protein
MNQDLTLRRTFGIKPFSEHRSSQVSFLFSPLTIPCPVYFQFSIETSDKLITGKNILQADDMKIRRDDTTPA